MSCRSVPTYQRTVHTEQASCVCPDNPEFQVVRLLDSVHPLTRPPSAGPSDPSAAANGVLERSAQPDQVGMLWLRTPP